MNAVTIKICSGTTCFIMGAANLEALKDQLNPAWKDRVEIVWVRCLELCQDKKFSRAPFVTINGEPMGKATIPLILARIEEILSH